MEIQELTQPKTENSFFRRASGQGLARVMVAIITIIIYICALNRWPASKVSAGQNETGDPNHGREVFEKRCAGCHALDREKEGPRLRGVFGRKAGSITSFKYSDAVKSANVIWDASSLDQWLTDPDKLIPDSDMGFRLSNATDRSDVIAYLKQLSNK
jgi:cytochrome c